LSDWLSVYPHAAPHIFKILWDIFGHLNELFLKAAETIFCFPNKHKAIQHNMILFNCHDRLIWFYIFFVFYFSFADKNKKLTP